MTSDQTLQLNKQKILGIVKIYAFKKLICPAKKWSSKIKVKPKCFLKWRFFRNFLKKQLNAIAKNRQHHRWTQTAIYKKRLDLQLLFQFYRFRPLDSGWTPFFFYLSCFDHGKGLENSLWSEPCVLESDYDQTQRRSKRLWSDPSATETIYDQTFQTKLTSDQTEPRPWSRL